MTLIDVAMHVADEGIRMDATLEGIRGVKLLREGGRITAASASQICDGASGCGRRQRSRPEGDGRHDRSRAFTT